MVYVRGNSVPHANLGVLDKLIAARHELAQVLYLCLQLLEII
jgi:intermediate peptidase